MVACVFLVGGISFPSRRENAPSGKQKGSVLGGMNVRFLTLLTPEVHAKVLRAGAPRVATEVAETLARLTMELLLQAVSGWGTNRVGVKAFDRHRRQKGRVFLLAGKLAGLLVSFTSTVLATVGGLATFGTSLSAGFTEIQPARLPKNVSFCMTTRLRLPSFLIRVLWTPTRVVTHLG